MLLLSHGTCIENMTMDQSEIGQTFLYNDFFLIQELIVMIWLPVVLPTSQIPTLNRHDFSTNSSLSLVKSTFTCYSIITVSNISTNNFCFLEHVVDAVVLKRTVLCLLLTSLKFM